LSRNQRRARKSLQATFPQVFCIRSAIPLGIITLTKHTQQLDIPAAPDLSGAGAPGFDVEISPAMLDAGVYALSRCDLAFDLSEQIVACVFRAMARADVDRRPS
jgi:hypothetical protein